MGRGEIRALPADPAHKTDELADVLAAERRRQGRENNRLRERGRGRSDLRHPREQRGHRQRPGLEQDRDVREAREGADILSGMQRFRQSGEVRSRPCNYSARITLLGYKVTACALDSFPRVTSSSLYVALRYYDIQ